MSPSPPTSPNASSHPRELVDVPTALAVISKVNLLAESKSLALDIGGSLAKLIYLQPYGTHTTSPPLVIHKVHANVASALSVHVPQLRGTLHFFAFETGRLHELLRFMRSHWGAGQGVVAPHRLIRATGGGSYKHEHTFEQEIGVKLARLDEMACTVAGLNFLLTSVQGEVYVYDPPEAPVGARRMVGTAVAGGDMSRATRVVDTTADPFPYLLVNIGSGVSIVKVTAHDTFERVSGSSLGGGTFWGLARLLLDCESFEEIMRLTNRGDNANVDMLVGDIYGGAYESIGLDPSIIAASFGKATLRHSGEGAVGGEVQEQVSTSVWERVRTRFVRAVEGSARLWGDVLEALPGVGGMYKALRGQEEKCKFGGVGDVGARFRAEDIALALLRMVAYNIGQIACLNARVHNLDRIYFGGNFIRNHRYTIADIAFAVDFWAGGKMQALFLRHDGYLGAIGAFIGASSKTPERVVERRVKGRSVKQNGARVSENVDVGKLLGKPARPKRSAVEKEEAPPANGTMKSTDAADELRKENGVRMCKKKEKKAAADADSIERNGSVGSSTGSQSTAMGDVQMEKGPTVEEAPEAEWTTVTRVRRKGGSRD